MIEYIKVAIACTGEACGDLLHTCRFLQCSRLDDESSRDRCLLFGEPLDSEGYIPLRHIKCITSVIKEPN